MKASGLHVSASAILKGPHFCRARWFRPAFRPNAAALRLKLGFRFIHRRSLIERLEQGRGARGWLHGASQYDFLGFDLLPIHAPRARE